MSPHGLKEIHILSVRFGFFVSPTILLYTLEMWKLMRVPSLATVQSNFMKVVHASNFALDMEEFTKAQASMDNLPCRNCSRSLPHDICDAVGVMVGVNPKTTYVDIPMLLQYARIKLLVHHM